SPCTTPTAVHTPSLFPYTTLFRSTFTLDTSTTAATVALTHDTAGAGTTGTTSDLLTSDASLTVSGQESGTATTYSVDSGGFSSRDGPSARLDSSHPIIVHSTF